LQQSAKKDIKVQSVSGIQSFLTL